MERDSDAVAQQTFLFARVWSPDPYGSFLKSKPHMPLKKI